MNQNLVEIIGNFCSGTIYHYVLHNHTIFSTFFKDVFLFSLVSVGGGQGGSVSTEAQRPEEADKSPGAEVIGSCKPPNLGAENQTWSSGRAARTFFFWAIIQPLPQLLSLWQI